jgi:hypothetical protein
MTAEAVQATIEAWGDDVKREKPQKRLIISTL